MNIINFIFGFRGRTNRAYFALLLPLFITIQILMVFFSLAISNALASAKQMSLQVSDLMEIFTVLLIFPIYFWLKYAYVAKRAHDFNKSSRKQIGLHNVYGRSFSIHRCNSLPELWLSRS